MFLGDSECPGHDASGMFTLSNYSILDLAPRALPRSAHHAQGLDHPFHRWYPKYHVLFSLLAADKGKAAMCFGEEGKIKCFQHIKEGTTGGVCGKGMVLSIPLRLFSSGNVSRAVQSDRKGRNTSDCQNGKGL